MPSATQAKESAKKIFSIVDDESTLDSRVKLDRVKVAKGEIEFKEVSFSYPTRKHRVLRNFDLHIPAGMKIGLVGHSGCGKSTITNLLLRYYNLKKGKVFIDGVSIEDYDITALRD
jgi:subfamily B ATP-binding cassette protein MsbA